MRNPLKVIGKFIKNQWKTKKEKHREFLLKEYEEGRVIKLNEENKVIVR